MPRVRLLALLSGVLLIASFSHAQTATSETLMLDLPRQSQHARVMQRIGITDITVNYHRPLANGRPIWGKLVEGATARAGIENLLIAGTESLPKSRATPAGCMAVLAAVGDEWPAAIARVAKKVRLEMLGMLHARLETAVAKGELPASTDVDGLSRFYLSVFQGMAIQARDGATQAELRAVAAAAMAAWPGNG